MHGNVVIILHNDNKYKCFLIKKSTFNNEPCENPIGAMVLLCQYCYFKMAKWIGNVWQHPVVTNI